MPTLTTPSQSSTAADAEPGVPGTGATGVILAGGRGTRVGGADKGLLTFKGEPAVVHVARVMRQLCDEIVVSANRNLDRYDSLGLGSVVADEKPGYLGPLAGIDAVGTKAKGDYLLIATCDTPKLQLQVLRDLHSALLGDKELDVAYAVGSDGPHYLCAAIRTACTRDLGRELDGGIRAVRHWYETIRCRAIPFTGSLGDSLANLNDSRDWETGC